MHILVRPDVRLVQRCSSFGLGQANNIQTRKTGEVFACSPYLFSLVFSATPH